MEVTKELLLRVAALARLKLSEKEANDFIPQLREIVESFSKLDEVDTKGVKPSFHPVELKNRTREDKEEAPLSQTDALSNTEHKKDGYFKGPKAL